MTMPFNHRYKTRYGASVAVALKRDEEKAYRKLLNALAKEIIKSTPVDTGLAAGHWKFGLSLPSVMLRADKSGPKNPRRRPIKVDRAKVKRAIEMKRPVFLYNRLPYIKRLADGWSKQAPPGWIVAAVQRVLAKGR
jgi:hypothetical protein